MTTPKIWFVTEASKGLGLTLVQQLVAAGYAVAATSRKLADLQQAVSGETDRFLPLQMDLGDEESVRRAIETTISTLGGLDVVVNNAGYGQLGGLEELTRPGSPPELRRECIWPAQRAARRYAAPAPAAVGPRVQSIIHRRLRG